MNQIVFNIEKYIDNQTDRYRSILGIPRRKGTSLVIDINHILSIINSNDRMLDDEFNYWIREEFNIAKNTAVYVRPTLERANIVMKSGSIIKLTSSGLKYFQGGEIAYLARGFLDNYYGFLELVNIIEHNKLVSRSEIFNLWLKTYEKDIGVRKVSTHRSQFNIILRYLTGLNLVLTDKNSFRVNYITLNQTNKINFI